MPEKGLRRWRRALVTALVAAVVLPAIVTLGLVWARGWSIQSVRTGSMEPWLPRGAAAVIAPIEPADVDPGTVVSFHDPARDHLVTHRVVRVVEDDGELSFVTRGDANLVDDAELVPARNIRGEVRWRVLGLGALVQWLQRPPVQIGLLAVPLALLALSELHGRRARRRDAASAERIAELEAELAWLRERLGSAPTPSCSPISV